MSSSGLCHHWLAQWKSIAIVTFSGSTPAAFRSLSCSQPCTCTSNAHWRSSKVSIVYLLHFGKMDGGWKLCWHDIVCWLIITHRSTQFSLLSPWYWQSHMTPLKLKVTERCSAVPQNSAVIASQWPVGCVEAADPRCTGRCAHLECGHLCLHSYHSYLLSR